jgi:hypothetical protein
VIAPSVPHRGLISVAAAKLVVRAEIHGATSP